MDGIVDTHRCAVYRSIEPYHIKTEPDILLFFILLHGWKLERLYLLSCSWVGLSNTDNFLWRVCTDIENNASTETFLSFQVVVRVSVLLSMYVISNVSVTL